MISEDFKDSIRILIDADMKSRIKAAAAAKGLTVSAWGRQAFDKHLLKNEPAPIVARPLGTTVWTKNENKA